MIRISGIENLIVLLPHLDEYPIPFLNELSEISAFKNKLYSFVTFILCKKTYTQYFCSNISVINLPLQYFNPVAYLAKKS